MLMAGVLQLFDTCSLKIDSSLFFFLESELDEQAILSQNEAICSSGIP